MNWRENSILILRKKRNIEICFNISTVWTNRLAYVKRLIKLTKLVSVLLYGRFFFILFKIHLTNFKYLTFYVNIER